MSRAILRNVASNFLSRKYLKICVHFSDTATSASISASVVPQHQGELADKQRFASHGDFYDITIVGGGMVGMALACSLATTPLTKHLNVAIIDGNPALGSKLCIKKEGPPDPRVSTVTPATISLFKDVGAWEYVQQHRHSYFDKMQVWDYTGLGYTKYDAGYVNKEILGCVVENRVLLNSLWSRIKDTHLKKSLYPCKLTSMSLHPSSSSMAVDSLSPGEALYNKGRLAKLELSDGSSLYARLVVGADGGKSRVRELAGFSATGWKYPQSAVICTIEHTVENHCAWQRFLPSGPIALLPIGQKYSNIVWTMNPEQASDYKSMNEIDFVNVVNKALDYGYGPHPKTSTVDGPYMFSWLRDLKGATKDSFEVPPKVVKLASARMTFPLSLLHANDYASNRVVLVGDAAHTVHPLAGQGVNLGFGDAFSLARIISEGIAVGMDIGEISLLKKYETERKPVNMAMMAILEGFQKAYSVDFGPLNVLRATAFHVAHHVSPLKRSIISYASGEQRLPLFT